MALLGRTVRWIVRYKVPAMAPAPAHVLSDDLLIGYGSQRSCYAHPTDRQLCIKVPKHPAHPEAQQANLVDWHYARSLDRRGVSHAHRARIHGWAPTTQADGLLVERIRNDDGTPAVKLQHALKYGIVQRDEAAALLRSLKQWVLTNHIAVHDLSPGNLLLKQTTAGNTLILIDGIGGQKIKLKFLLYLYSPRFARAITRWRWPAFERKIQARLDRVTPMQPSLSHDE